MYRRYSQAGNPTMSISQRNQIRLRSWVILILCVVLIALCVIGIPAYLSNQETRSFYIHRMLTDCEEAVRITNTLSRNAGADSSAMLAKIRSSIYGMETLNVLSGNLSGMNGTLINGNMLTDIKSSIDLFLSNLTTGMDTGEQVTNLQTRLNELLDVISTLE